MTGKSLSFSCLLSGGLGGYSAIVNTVLYLL